MSVGNDSSCIDLAKIEKVNGIFSRAVKQGCFDGLTSWRIPVIKIYHIWIYEMTKVIDRPNCVNWIGTFQCEDNTHYKTSFKCRPSQTVIHRLHHLEGIFVDLQVLQCRLSIRHGEINKKHSRELFRQRSKWSVSSNWGTVLLSWLNKSYRGCSPQCYNKDQEWVE